MTKSFNFVSAPGQLIRRAQQIAVAIFMVETADFDVTPVQFAIFNALMDDPGEDQITLSGSVGFDPATLGSVVSGWRRKAGSNVKLTLAINGGSDCGARRRGRRSR